MTKARFDKSFARFFRFRGDSRQADPDFSLAVIDIRVLTFVDPVVTATLSLRRGARVLAIHRTIIQDEIVVYHYMSYLSHAEFGELSKADIENSVLYDVLEIKFDVHIVRATKTLQARAASAQDAEILQIRREEPVIAVERVAYTYHEQPVEFRRTIGRSDTFRYEIQLS